MSILALPEGGEGSGGSSQNLPTENPGDPPSVLASNAIAFRANRGPLQRSTTVFSRRALSPAPCLAQPPGSLVAHRENSDVETEGFLPTTEMVVIVPQIPPTTMRGWRHTAEDLSSDAREGSS